MSRKNLLTLIVILIASVFFLITETEDTQESDEIQTEAPEIGLIKASYVGEDDYDSFKMNISSLRIDDPYSSYELNLSKSIYNLSELNNTLLYNYSASDRIYDVRLDFNIYYRNNSSVVYSRNASQVFSDVNFSERDAHVIINATERDSEGAYDQDGGEGIDEQDENQSSEEQDSDVDQGAEGDDDPDPDGDRTHGEEDKDINDLLVNGEFRFPNLRVYGSNE